MTSKTEEMDRLYVRQGNGRYAVASDERLMEAVRRLADRRIGQGTQFAEPAVALRYFRHKLVGLEREVFAVAFLDARHRLIHYEELFRGTIDAAEVHPREVVKAALRHNAAAVMLAHNHPSGVVEPSAMDRAVTVRLKQALALVDVRLLDHFIVGGNAGMSMADRGLV